MNILLIDKRVQGHETIVAAIDPALAVGVVFDYFEDTYDTLKARMRDLGIVTATSIGLVQHNYRAPTFSMLAAAAEQNAASSSCIVSRVATRDPDLATWARFRDFIVWCKTEHGAAHFDMMACALYSDPDWKYVIDALATQTGITIRASTDNTGPASMGGNWFLESHTGVNLKGVYFTAAIEEYRGVLYVYSYDNREYSTKFAPGNVIAWGNDVSYVPYELQSNNTVVAVYSVTEGIFMALRADGTLVKFGDSDSSNTLSVPHGLSSGGVLAVYSTQGAFAALKTDGSVVAWGNTSFGGVNFNNYFTTNVVAIWSTERAFAALKNTGEIIAWGDSNYGGTAAYGIESVVAVYSTDSAFAALKTDGTVATWGNSSTGGDSNAVTVSGVIAVYSTSEAFAALNNAGGVVAWGNSSKGGTTPENVESDVVAVYSNRVAFAALKANGSVVAWGTSNEGGSLYFTNLSTYSTTSVSSNLGSGVVTICSNELAFAALKTDGSVVMWGSGWSLPASVSAANSGVVAVYSTKYAFAALKSDGSVVAWGASGYGPYGEQGGSAPLSVTDTNSGVVAIYSTNNTFAALKSNGSMVVWGGSLYEPPSAVTNEPGVVAVYSNKRSFAVLKSPGISINISVLTDMDRYDILRKKENRRRLNLNTSNNDVFTLSQSNHITRFNPTIPADKILRIIVPTYAASSYSITSVATIPTGADSINYIIACDEGEPVTVSGITYVNYGSYAYKRETNNTYTKLTAAQNISGASYTMYGGDGINSSGIALIFTGLVVMQSESTLSSSAFTVPATKNYGNEPFTITAPTTNSSGAITYSSNAPGVATIDASTGVITLVSAGTVTFTASQAATSQYSTATVTSNTLTVALGTTTLSTLTVPALKAYGDASFEIIAPAPTSASSGAITYSSNAPGVATIDASTGVITLVSAGTATFTASQAATAQYAAPAAVTSNTLTVSLLAPTLSTFAVAASKAYGDASFNITTAPTSASNGAITYSSNTPGVATIDESTGVITLVSAGTATFTASQAATAQYAAPASVTSNELTVSLGAPTLSTFTVPDLKAYGSAPFNITTAPTSASSGAITYSSNAPGVATIDESTGIITLVSAGTATFTASQAATAQYAAPASVTSNELTVSLAGQIVAPGTSFAGVDLSGASLVGAILAGVSFAGAALTNANFSGATVTGAVFSNANIVGATNLPLFSTAQKLQLLRNTNNVAIGAVQIATPLSGAEINAAITTPVPDIVGATFIVKPPTYNSSNEKVVTVVTEDLANAASIYIPMNSGETVTVNGVAYTFDGAAVLDSVGTTITSASVLGVPFGLYAGSIIMLNQSLRAPTISAFVVAGSKILGDAAFTISARPVSNSSGAITYTSSSPGIATIDASGNWITPISVGAVTFTASQAEVPGEYYTAATVVSNVLHVVNATTCAPNNRWFSTNNSRTGRFASDRMSSLRARTLYRDTMNSAANGGSKVIAGRRVVYSAPISVQCLGLGEGVESQDPTECVAVRVLSAASYRDLIDTRDTTN